MNKGGRGVNRGGGVGIFTSQDYKLGGEGLTRRFEKKGSRRSKVKPGKEGVGDLRGATLTGNEGGDPDEDAVEDHRKSRIVAELGLRERSTSRAPKQNQGRGIK